MEAAAASHRRPPTMEFPQWSQTCDTSTVTLVTCDKNSKTLEKRTSFELLFWSQSNHLDLVPGPWQLSSSENLRDLGIDKFTAINLPDLTSSLMDWFYFTLSLEYTSCKSDLLYKTVSYTCSFYSLSSIKLFLSILRLCIIWSAILLSIKFLSYPIFQLLFHGLDQRTMTRLKAHW